MDKEFEAEVEELASLQFTKEEIKTVVGEGKKIDPIWIKRGRLKAEAEVRKSILSQAKQGSSSAQKEYMNIISNRERQERREKAKNDSK